MLCPRKMCASVGVMVLLVAGPALLGAPAPVGLLESLDVEVLQGGQSLFQFTSVSTVGLLSGQDIYLGTSGQGTRVSIRVQADQANTPLVEDRWMKFTIRGTDLAGNGANLFDPSMDGSIEVKLTNLKFDNVDGVNGTQVSPFNPADYSPYPLTELPFFYMLDEYRGFVNLPGSERYSPGEAPPYDLGGWADPSIQVPMRIWSNPAWGYSFSQVDNGHLTGFHLGGITDFGGTGTSHAGALALTPVLAPQVWPYFGPTAVPPAAECGFVSEIGIDLNFRAVHAPEPSALLLLVLPLLSRRIARVR